MKEQHWVDTLSRTLARGEGFSRQDFLKLAGATVVVALLGGPRGAQAEPSDEQVSVERTATARKSKRGKKKGNDCPANQTCPIGCCPIANGVCCSDGGCCPVGTTCGPVGSKSCVCAAGQFACDNLCVDLRADNTNCGACGTVCPPDRPCQDGRCGGACPPGQTTCPDGCCTAANAVCCPGFCCPGGSACGPDRTCVCPPAQITCSDRCVDVQTDPANCGGCGKACSASQFCQAGTCAERVCPPGQTTCPNGCCSVPNAVCCADFCCPAGTTCGPNRSCICADSQIACANRCVDPQTDGGNCGGCGTACSAGQACRAGQCVGSS